MKVCLVEDDDIMGESILQRFEFEDVECDWFTNGEEALDALTRQTYGALVSDVRLPGMGGQELFESLQQANLSLPTMFMTGFGNINQAVYLLKLGASDYITKPFNLDALLLKLKQISPEIFQPDDNQAVLGVSQVMRQVERQIQRAVSFPVPILITGESGVGKEYAAKYFWELLQGDGSMPFVSLNCAAVQESLLEAELFGYEKGAFTSADKLHKGLFEQASNGVLFLDEVGEMSAAMQAKLLRVIQESLVRRVGGEVDIAVKVRILCATNRDLSEMVEDGLFREDLFYRINVVNATLPPLRERKEDILWFAHKLIRAFSELDEASNYFLSPGAENYLRNQPWPGNIRQLNNAIIRACIEAVTPQLEESHFVSAKEEATEPQVATSPSLKHYLELREAERIAEVLQQSEGKINDSAQVLGISRKNLWEKMRKYQL